MISHLGHLGESFLSATTNSSYLR